MNEIKIIDTIKEILSNNYIGDDCAYLKDLNIVVTQDSLVEDVHFLRKSITPFQLGYKSVAVNLSDIYASGGIVKYLTVSLSLPKDIDSDFVKNFYEGAKSALNGAEIVGGDITGSDKIFVSITAIGSTKGRRISSRKNAKVGYKIITNGSHGSSGAGLYSILKNIDVPKKFIDSHLMPKIDSKLSEVIATTAKFDYAMMDSSDGLADALCKIAYNSNVLAEIDFEKIPYDEEIKNIQGLDYKKSILFGGEDYKLVCAISQEDLKNIPFGLYTEIGEIKEKQDEHVIKFNFSEKVEYYTKEDIEKFLFSHF